MVCLDEIRQFSDTCVYITYLFIHLSLLQNHLSLSTVIAIKNDLFRSNVRLFWLTHLLGSFVMLHVHNLTKSHSLIRYIYFYDFYTSVSLLWLFIITIFFLASCWLNLYMYYIFMHSPYWFFYLCNDCFVHQMYYNM